MEALLGLPLAHINKMRWPQIVKRAIQLEV